MSGIDGGLLREANHAYFGLTEDGRGNDSQVGFAAHDAHGLGCGGVGELTEAVDVADGIYACGGGLHGLGVDVDRAVAVKLDVESGGNDGAASDGHQDDVGAHCGLFALAGI